MSLLGQWAQNSKVNFHLSTDYIKAHLQLLFLGPMVPSDHSRAPHPLPWLENPPIFYDLVPTPLLFNLTSSQLGLLLPRRQQPVSGPLFEPRTSWTWSRTFSLHESATERRISIESTIYLILNKNKVSSSYQYWSVQTQHLTWCSWLRRCMTGVLCMCAAICCMNGSTGCCVTGWLSICCIISCE
jgi:hypothetical protein